MPSAGRISPRCPCGAQFHARTEELLLAPRRGAPQERGGRYFVLGNPGHADQDLLYTADTLGDLVENPRVLLDPNALSDDGTVAMTTAQVSPGGCVRRVRARRRWIRLAHGAGAGRRLRRGPAR